VYRQGGGLPDAYKHAVAAAMKAAREFYAGKELVDLDLEEVEMSPEQDCWLITLGFYVPDLNPTSSILSNLMLEGQKRYDRKYKIFSIDGQTGNVISMKIRAV
jgi:hypothetical protein